MCPYGLSFGFLKTYFTNTFCKRSRYILAFIKVAAMCKPRKTKSCNLFGSEEEGWGLMLLVVGSLIGLVAITHVCKTPLFLKSLKYVHQTFICQREGAEHLLSSHAVCIIVQSSLCIYQREVSLVWGCDVSSSRRVMRCLSMRTCVSCLSTMAIIWDSSFFSLFWCFFLAFSYAAKRLLFTDTQTSQRTTVIQHITLNYNVFVHMYYSVGMGWGLGGADINKVVDHFSTAGIGDMSPRTVFKAALHTCVIIRVSDQNLFPVGFFPTEAVF